MMRRLRPLVVLVALVLGVSFPAVTHAQIDPDDTISLTAPAGPVYADYPFAFTGSGTADGLDADDYEVDVLFVPSGSPILSGGCPSDYNATAEEIEQAFGGPDAIADYSQEGVTDPFLLEQGAYTWEADVNDDVVATVTATGSYIACAYLDDEFGAGTYAVSGPVPFTVTDAPGTGVAPTGFGGPPGTKEPSLGLKVIPRHRPIRAPGRNLLRISGSYDLQGGPADLTVTLKSTRRFNGCASGDAQDLQITQADGGAVLAESESVIASSAGNFTAPLALNFKKRVSGTAVLCAYLVDGFGEDLAEGYLRFSAQPPKVIHKKPHQKHPKKHHERTAR